MAYIRETYTGFLNEKLNRKCRVPIFPLEGGTSWRMLLDQLSDEAKSRAEEALRDSLSGIREAILRRQGNRLAAIIDRLRDRTETMNMTLESEIREALLALREREKAAEKSIEECQRSLASLAKEEEKAAKTAARRNEGAPKLPQPMPPSFDRLELIRTWFGRIRNKDHSLRDQITNLFTEAGDAYFQEATVSTVFHALNIRKTQHFVNQALDDNDAFEELIHRIEPGQKVKPRELEDRFEDAAAEFCARLWRSADQAVRTAWKKQNSPSQNEWYLAQLRSTYPKTLKKHQQRLREIQDSILQREQQEAKLKEDLLADLNTLSTYLAAAKQCYDRYFRQCIRRMPGLARQEQMQMLVHLGLIERDYNHIMMGGSLNGSKET